MAPWNDDLSTSTVEDVLKWQAENRAWGKELRIRANSLVNRRLAKDISQSDYLADRKINHEASTEWRRRANMLDAQMGRCKVGQSYMNR